MLAKLEVDCAPDLALPPH